jgi:hypothetical protein
MSEKKTPDEQLSALKAFARWAIKSTACFGCSLDGSDVQSEALKLGIIEERNYNASFSVVKWKDVEDISSGDLLYAFADWVKKVPAKNKSDEPPEGKAVIEGEHEASNLLTIHRRAAPENQRPGSELHADQQIGPLQHHARVRPCLPRDDLESRGADLVPGQDRDLQEQHGGPGALQDG